MKNFFLLPLLALSLGLASCDEAGPAEEVDQEQAGDRLESVDAEGFQAVVAANEGKVTVVDVWATWCAPCIAMFDPLADELKLRGDGVRKLSLSVDGKEDFEAAEEQLKKFKGNALRGAYIVPEPVEQEKVLAALGGKPMDIAPPIVFVFDQKGDLAGTYEAMEIGELINAVTAKVDELTGYDPANPPDAANAVTPVSHTTGCESCTACSAH